MISYAIIKLFLSTVVLLSVHIVHVDVRRPTSNDADNQKILISASSSVDYELRRRKTTDGDVQLDLHTLKLSLTRVKAISVNGSLELNTEHFSPFT